MKLNKNIIVPTAIGLAMVIVVAFHELPFMKEYREQQTNEAEAYMEAMLAPRTTTPN